MIEGRVARNRAARRDDDPAAVLVSHVVGAMRRAGRRVPAEASILGAITDVTVEDTIEGSSTLTVHLRDEDDELMDSGFFDANRDGKLDRIECNYPPGSRFWWRLTELEVDMQVVQMVFMERAAVALMALRGPLKANRAKVTRAEFLKSLADRARPRIELHSRELHKRQPVERTRRQSAEERKKLKSPGINASEELTIKRARATGQQLRTAERMLDTADRLGAPRIASVAMLYAAIGESSLGAETGVNSMGYGGVLGANASVWGSEITDVELQARYFLLGGRGFQAGGGIALARSGVTNPREIAIRVEVPSIWPDNAYEAQAGHHRFLPEAEAILEAYGGEFGGVMYRKQYNFQVGSQENPREDFWAASQRLAEEVNWAYFVDGDDVYFDAETTLVRQKPAAIIERGEAAVARYRYTWDARHICTEMTLELVCRPFQFRAGEVLRLRGFGTASTGTTARLPGRWLIATIEGSAYAPVRTLTLKQPERPEREPASELVERREPDSFSAADLDREMTPKQIIDEIVLPIAAECGIRLTPLQVQEANARHGPTTSGGTSDHQGPPNVRWAADISNGSSPTPQMDRVARRIAEALDIPPIDLDAYSSPGNAKSSTHDGFRFQLIYRSEVGGDHTNHVHIGIART